LSHKTLQGLLALTTLLALATSAAWYQARSAARESQAQFVVATLEPIDALLKTNQVLMRELATEPFAEPGTGILQSYIDKIRRDGVQKHADMKQRLDELADNNATIVALLKAYATHARTAAFTLEADRFRNYASAWRDRWNSVMELFMAGGGYAASEVPFPAAFPTAVEAEIAATR
jgi:hypothetical protein